MKNGDVREFVDHIHYGDELWFLYEGKNTFWKDGQITAVLIFAYTKWQAKEKNISGKGTQHIIRLKHS